MEDILQSIKAFLYDRASSPLFGAFIVSWMMWNYRFIIILLSEEKYSNKFSGVDDYINSSVFVIPWTEITLNFYVSWGGTIPLVTALLYIYVYPFAAEPVYRYSLKKQKNINKLKKEANDSRVLDEKDSRKLFQDLADMQVKYDTDIGQYQKQVASLKVTIDEQKDTAVIKKDAPKKEEQKAVLDQEFEALTTRLANSSHPQIQDESSLINQDLSGRDFLEDYDINFEQAKLLQILYAYCDNKSYRDRKTLAASIYEQDENSIDLLSIEVFIDEFQEKKLIGFHPGNQSLKLNLTPLGKKIVLGFINRTELMKVDIEQTPKNTE